MRKQCSARDASGKGNISRKGAAGARKRQGAGGSISVDGNLLREEDVTQHTEIARELVLAAWPGIVQGLIKKAKSGGYQHAKLLLELGELTGTDNSQLNNQRQRQLCDALLEGLGLPAEQVEDAAAKLNANQEPENTEAL